MTLSFLLDLLIFTVVPWGIWLLIRRTLPLAVLPILLGMLAAAFHLPLRSVGLPSPLGNQLGFIGVILLAFTAGLEMRHPAESATPKGRRPAARDTTIRVPRLLMSAALALALPFVAGTLASYYHFLDLPAWAPARGKSWVAAASIGLCIAVSALPVLVGLVRELRPHQQRLGMIALSVALIDDAVLWLGLAALQIAANIDPTAHWGWRQDTAILLLVLLGVAGYAADRYRRPVHPIVAWSVAVVFLAAGAWSSARLGIHELIGAYAAGALLPPGWMRRIHIERIGQFGLIILAPLFFGHSGLNIDGDLLGWSSLLAASGLLFFAVLTKMCAIVLVPPARNLSGKERWGVGTLLQCKGLMEIVAATVLHGQGLLSEEAYATLVSLAVISTSITGPAFQWIMRERARDRTQDEAPEYPAR